MTRSRYEISPGTAPIEQLPRHLPALQEPPSEMRPLLAGLVALDSAKRRAAEYQAAAAVPLQLQLPQWPQS